MKAVNYSLWLIPKGAEYDRFANLIKRLADEYNGPIFEPHITLLGSISQTKKEVIEKARQLCLGQKPFPITLQTVDYQDFFFRALYIQAQITEPLLKMHNQAKELFNMQHIPPYMPHLSLLYGNYSLKIKKEIIKKIGKDQNAKWVVSSIHIDKEGGDPTTWHRVQEFPLNDTGSEYI